MARRKKRLPPIPSPLAPRREPEAVTPATDAALAGFLQDAEFHRAVVWSAGRGQAALPLATRGETIVYVMDLWDAAQSRRFLDSRGAAGVEVFCGPDWPDGESDLAAISLPHGGQEELALDLIQSAWLGLVEGGRLMVSIAGKSGPWLRKTLKVYTHSISERVIGKSVVMSVAATGGLKRIRDWRCELQFRDQGRLVRLQTRPGVFAHRQMDNGARQLLNSVQLEPGARVLDIGCGSGAVAIGLACRDPSIDVLAVDSHARAVDCTRVGAELNGLSNVATLLSHDGQFGEVGEFDVALGNPPYYSGFRIAGLFCEAAERYLRPGGRVILVTKSPDWFRERLPKTFDGVDVFESGRYHIATGVKRGGGGGEPPEGSGPG